MSDLKADRLEIHRLSLRHFLGNHDRPIFKLLLKNRSVFRMPLQCIKTLIFQTTLVSYSPKSIYCRQSDRIGLAVTYNQFAGLAKYCDVVICLDRRGYSSDCGTSAKTEFYLAFLPRYLVELAAASLYCIVRDPTLFRYIDIIARQRCIDHERLFAMLSKSKKPIYVSNLNNPLILYIKAVLKDSLSWAHVPHATLGDTILPELSFVNLYVANDDRERVRLRDANWPCRIYAKREAGSQSFIPSKPGHYFLLLPKNYWDVELDHFSKIRDATITVKFHPSILLPMRKLWCLWFFVRTRKKVAEKSALQTNSRILSVSSSVVYEALRAGKCIYKLPMRFPPLDHYGFNAKLLEFDRPETEADYDAQKREILVDA